MSGGGGGAGAGAKKGARWSWTCRRTGQPTSGTVPIRFGTYNISNGLNGGVESALRGMSQANMDLGIFQETNVTDGIYTHGLAGYSVVATDAPIRHRGGVAVFHQPAPHFSVEAVQQFGPKVIRFQLVTGERRWYIMVCYLAPDDTSTIERVVEALKERPKGAELLVEGDLNANLAEPEGDRGENDVAAKLATEGLEDMAAHFLPRRRPWCRDGRTWSMLQKGREVRSWMDYILGTDHRLFGNVSVRDPRHNSDHYMVLDCLHSTSMTDHKRYLRGKKNLPLQQPTKPTREDKIFSALRRAFPKPRAREARKNEWILAETWRLIDERVSAPQDTAKGQNIIRRLGCAIKTSLTADRRRLAEEAEVEVEALVGADPPLIQEAWHRIKGW